MSRGAQKLPTPTSPVDTKPRATALNTQQSLELAFLIAEMCEAKRRPGSPSMIDIECFVAYGTRS